MQKNKVLRLAITGANGFVGSNVGRILSRKGISVIGIVRKGKDNSVKFGVPVVSCNFSERYLISKLRRCKALLHLIGTGKQTVDSDFQTINVGITNKVVSLCKKAGIKKIIYLSGLGVHKKNTSSYFISKYLAEQEIIRSCLDYTIFRASYILGNNDPLSRTLFKQIKNGKIIIPGSGSYRLQPIFVDDVAEVFLQSITSKKYSKKIFDLVGPQIITYKNFVRDFAQGRGVKIKNINLEEAYRNALDNSKWIFGLDDLNILVGNYIGNHKKLKKISGIKFKTYKQILQSGRTS